MKIFFSERCLKYFQIGHPESPQRVQSTYRFLQDKGFEFIEPIACSDEDILLVHTKRLLNGVKSGSLFDPDTPPLPDIFEYARLSAGSAVMAAEACLNGEKTFSLMRPPGHHATRDMLGGFCYFNNIAIASVKIKNRVKRIAIIDFDCHHGNGTEDIFLGKKGFLYLSLHQSPLYPGTGLTSKENCINYPLPPNTTPKEYLRRLEDGLAKVKDFNPDVLAISAGFDTYKLDPITDLSLEKETYYEIGRMLSEIGKPTFSVLEGGYSKDLPECVYQFLKGLI
ncbi:MAG: histone deacetylase family protein [Thermodesulfovibrionia bacterium]